MCGHIQRYLEVFLRLFRPKINVAIYELRRIRYVRVCALPYGLLGMYPAGLHRSLLPTDTWDFHEADLLCRTVD